MSDVTVQPSSDMRQRWGMPRFGYYSNALMLWVGGKFLWLAYVVVWFVAAYFFLFVRKARRGSRAYLDRLRPGRGALRRSWETYRHMVEFGLLIMDRALMLRNPRHGFALSCDGVEHLTRASMGNEGVLLLTAHFGNAEIAAPYMRQVGLSRPMHIVMYQNATDGTERFHSHYRRMLDNIHIISSTDPLSAGTRIMRALHEGDVVAMRADRTMQSRGVDAELLGGHVGFPSGPFLAAALSGAPLVQVYTCRLGYRRYKCVFRPIRKCGDDLPGTRDERMAASAQDFATGLEDVMRQFPYQWSNFYDFWTEQGAGRD